MDVQLRMYVAGLCVSFLITATVGGNKPVLLVSNSEIWENDNVMLTCICNRTTTDLQPWPSWWYSSDNGLTGLLLYINGSFCDVRFLLANTTLFTYICYRNSTYEVKLNNVNRQHNGVKWACECGFLAGNERSEAAEINVNVPIQSVGIMLENLNISRNTQVQIVNGTQTTLDCVPSCGRPQANITWYQWIQSTLNVVHILEDILPNTTVDSNGLICSKARLLLSPSVSNHQDEFYCTASNKDEQSYKSPQIKFDVMFPPTDPEFKYRNESGKPIERKHLRVLKGRNVTVACVSRGNPHPRRQWLNETNNSSLLTVYNVSKDLTKTCTAYNTMIETSGVQQTGTSASTLSVSVLYPPYNPSLRLRYGNVNKVIESSSTIHIIENSSFTLLCNTTSNPPPEYIWKGHAQIQSESLTIEDVKRKQSGVYTCHTSNTMQPSFDSTVTGNSDANISINILYPPDIDEMKNSSAVEGSKFSILCPVLPGNPSNQTVQWKSEDNNLITSSAILSIQNVSRDDDMMYTCILTYTMKPTGDIAVVGEVNKPFYLTVFYRAVVTKFTTIDPQTDTDVIVNNFDTVQFDCAVDSNPDSNISIVFNKKIVVRAAKSKRLTYNIAKADCSDAGVYTCIGSNDYNNGNMARANLTMFVKCKPKPSMVSRPIQSIKSALNMSATLTFTAASYLDPGETSFIWMRQRELKWIPLRNNENISITTYGLQSSLTIISAANTDFGEYLLVYNNSVGSSNFTFNLVVAASSSRPQIIGDSSNTTAFVAVGAGASVTTLIIGAIVFIAYRRLRRRSTHTQTVENHPHNQIASTYINMEAYDGMGEYERIEMSKDVENRKENVGYQTGTNRETESSFQYESIDNTKQETNQYSQLQVTCESRTDATGETDEEIRMDNDESILTVSDYINMRI